MRATGARCDSDFRAQGELSARNEPAATPLGEEEDHRASRSRPPRRASITINHAKRYRDALGLKLHTPALLYRPVWGKRDHLGFKVEHRGWQRADHPASLRTLTNALSGDFGLDLQAQGPLRVLTIDFDAGHDDAPNPAKHWHELIDDIDAERQRGRKKSMRQRVAAALAPQLEKLRGAFPGLSFAVFSSPRGAHVVLLLDEAVEAAELQDLGRRLLAALGSPSRAETFPKAETSGGRTCRLPLTGGASRMLGPALERELHRSREADLQALLALPRCSVDTLRTALGIESTRVDSPVPTLKKKSRPKAVPAGAPLAERLPVQLSGDDFEQAVLDAYQHGIPDDCSWPMTQKLAFLATAAGLPKPTAERFFKAFVALPQHEATHCRTDAGRKQLLAEFRACLKWQLRGLEAGTVTPGKLTRPALHRMIREVLGGKLRVTSLSDDTRHKLRAAGRMRWAKNGPVA